MARKITVTATCVTITPVQTPPNFRPPDVAPLDCFSRSCTRAPVAFNAGVTPMIAAAIAASSAAYRIVSSERSSFHQNIMRPMPAAATPLTHFKATAANASPTAAAIDDSTSASAKS